MGPEDWQIAMQLYGLSREQGKGKEDYRPVSLTSVGNIFESIINDDVLGYMEVNDKIGQSQRRDVA